jgi:hypothetical protein
LVTDLLAALLLAPAFFRPSSVKEGIGEGQAGDDCISEDWLVFITKEGI